MWVQSLGWEDPVEKETAIHSSILAWRISWTEEFGGLQFMGLQRFRHDWETNAKYTTMCGSWVVLVIKNPPVNAGDFRPSFDPWVEKIPWRRSWQPTLLFFPKESHGQRSLVGYSPFGGLQSIRLQRVRHHWSNLACTHGYHYVAFKTDATSRLHIKSNKAFKNKIYFQNR